MGPFSSRPVGRPNDEACPSRTGGFGLTRVGLLLRRLEPSEGVWSAATQALGSAVSFLVSLLAARLLGVDGFGIYVLVLACVSVVNILQYQLVAGPMMVMSGRRKRSSAYFGAVSRAVLSAALLAGATVAAFSFVLEDPTLTGRAFLMMAGFMAGAGYVIHDGVKRMLFANRRPIAAFSLEAARHILFVVLVTLCFLFFRVDSSILLFCLGLAPAVVALVFIFATLQNHPRQRLFMAATLGHWRLGRWMTLVVLVGVFHEQAVLIIAGAELGNSAAGGLRAAQYLYAPVLLVLMNSLENIVPRQAAERLRSGGPEAAMNYINRIIIRLLPPVVGFCMLVVAFRSQLLGLLGADFVSYGSVVAILAFAPPLIIARELIIALLRVNQNTSIIFISFVSTSVIVLVTIIPMIKLFGVEGAACVLLLGHLVSFAIILVYSYCDPRRLSVFVK